MPELTPWGFLSDILLMAVLDNSASTFTQNAAEFLVELAI